MRVENGALKAIPGSHKEGYLPWYRVKGETHHDRVKNKYVDAEKARYLEMNAGDALIFDAMLLHSSDACDSDKPRRAYRISYQGFDKVITPRGSPIVLRGGQPENMAARYPNRHKAKKIGLARRIINRIGRILAKFWFPVDRQTAIYLNLLRVIAASFVFLEHFSLTRISAGTFDPVGVYGHDAVMVFFVISGYVIAYVVNERGYTFTDYMTTWLED